MHHPLPLFSRFRAHISLAVCPHYFPVSSEIGCITVLIHPRFFVELVPLLKRSHGTSHFFSRFVWPLCLSFVQMSATLGEHVPGSAACFPACGTMEAWTTAAAGKNSLSDPTVHWRRITGLIAKKTGVTVSKHSQRTAMPWDCTVKVKTSHCRSLDNLRFWTFHDYASVIYKSTNKPCTTS